MKRLQYIVATPYLMGQIYIDVISHNLHFAHGSDILQNVTY